MKKIILITTLILAGCAYKVKTPIKPISFIETHELDTTKIRFNGYYHLIEDTVVFTNGYKYIFPSDKTSNLRIFNKNKNLYFNSGKINEYSPLTCEFYKKENDRYNRYKIKYLRYTIKNDSLYTYNYILITVGAGQRVPVYCNFRGFVKNRDTITNWKVIPPYPKDFTKFVKERNKDLFEPHTLYFVKTDAVKCLDMD
jgi:hypothetical protein